MGLCVAMIAFVRLPSLKVSCLLLSGLLIYDVFWVSVSPELLLSFRSDWNIHSWKCTRYPKSAVQGTSCPKSLLQAGTAPVGRWVGLCAWRLVRVESLRVTLRWGGSTSLSTLERSKALNPGAWPAQLSGLPLWVWREEICSTRKSRDLSSKHAVWKAWCCSPETLLSGTKRAGAEIGVPPVPSGKGDSPLAGVFLRLHL